MRCSCSASCANSAADVDSPKLAKARKPRHSAAATIVDLEENRVWEAACEDIKPRARTHSEDSKQSGDIQRIASWKEQLAVRTGGSVLAICAGVINSIALLAFGITVSHITGKLTTGVQHIGMGTVDAAFDAALIPLTFLAGAVVSGFIIGRSTVNVGRSLYGIALMLCACLLVLVTATAERGYVDRLAPCLASAACGLQNGLASTYSNVIIRTTHLTGLVTDVGMILGRLIRRFTCGVKPNSLTSPGSVRTDLSQLSMPLLLTGSFLIGALLGVKLHQSLSVRAFLVPAAALGFTGVLYTTYRVCVLGQHLLEVYEHVHATECVCGNLFMPDALYCRKCGTKRPNTTVRAEPDSRPTSCICGNVYMPDAVYCRKCGIKRPDEPSSPRRHPDAPPSPRKCPDASPSPRKCPDAIPSPRKCPDVQPGRTLLQLPMNKSNGEGDEKASPHIAIRL